MKSAILLGVLMTALVLAGCGKSSEEMSLEQNYSLAKSRLSQLLAAKNASDARTELLEEQNLNLTAGIEDLNSTLGAVQPCNKEGIKLLRTVEEKLNAWSQHQDRKESQRQKADSLFDSWAYGHTTNAEYAARVRPFRNNIYDAEEKQERLISEMEGLLSSSFFDRCDSESRT